MRLLFKLILPVVLVVLLPLDEVLASERWVKPSEGLDAEQQLTFWSGYSLFRDPWVVAPASTKGRDGLGPLFNARSCVACHSYGAGGKLFGSGFGSVVKVADPLGRPLAYYGKQIQDYSSHSFFAKKKRDADQSHRIQPEALVRIHWHLDPSAQYIPLNYYTLEFVNLGYGDIPATTQFSARFAPPLFGIGLLEKIEEEHILQYSDEMDQNGDGVSGKPNWVQGDQSGEKHLGRFGWKAEHPSLKRQIAFALAEDIGITSAIFPQQNCAPKQLHCVDAEHGNNEQGVEITDEKLAMLVSFVAGLRSAEGYAKTIGEQKERRSKGEKLFHKVGCAACHRPSFVVGERTIYPFTDMLLHDLGDGLANSFQVSDAEAGEWRTAPLWGMERRFQQKAQYFLHDGRASSLKEAIAWHGGEASTSRDGFFHLSSENQEELIQFLKSL